MPLAEQVARTINKLDDIAMVMVDFREVKDEYVDELATQNNANIVVQRKAGAAYLAAAAAGQVSNGGAGAAAASTTSVGFVASTITPGTNQQSVAESKSDMGAKSH